MLFTGTTLRKCCHLYSTVLVLSLLAGSAVHAQRIIDGIHTCNNRYSHADEQALGNKVAAQIFAQQPVLLDTDPVSVYVSQLGRKLVDTSPDPSWNFQFHVVDSSEINAFALPGGAIFVNLATVAAAESEAQLAGVLAHEISHVELRHSTCNLTKQQRRGMLYGLGQLAAGVALGGTAGSLASSGIGYAAGLNFLHMSRESEAEADQLGVRILYDAGYDPRGMTQFFEIIRAKYGNGGAQFLSDHPNPANRTQHISAEIARFPPRRSNVTTSPAFQRIRAIGQQRRPLTPEQLKSGAWRTSASYQHSPSQDADTIQWLNRKGSPALRRRGFSR